MPLVRIDAIRMEPARLEAVSDAVQDAMVETIDVPPKDRFHVLSSHDGTAGTLRHDTFLDVPRDDGVVYVEITLRTGRTDEQKKALYARICALAGERAQVAPHNVLVVLRENTLADWSFGYGEAQYIS